MERAVDASAAPDPITEFTTICEKVRAALHPVFVHGVQLYDERGLLLWLTASFGPKEDEAIRKAFDQFACTSGTTFLAYDLGGARSAVIFRVTNSTNEMLGAVLIVIGTRILQEYNYEPVKLLTRQLRFAMLYFAHNRNSSMAKPAHQSTNDVEPSVSFIPLPSAATSAPIPLDTMSAHKQFHRSVEALFRPPPPTGPTKRLSRFSPRPHSSVSPSVTSTSLDRSAPALRHLSRKPQKMVPRPPTLALVVQRLVSLREDTQPVRCEVLWALPRRPRKSVGHAGTNSARLMRMPSSMERPALIELCRWVRKQQSVWGNPLPIMWMKFSTGALLDKPFPRFLERCLTSSGFPKDHLGFEISARDAAARPDDLLNVATSLERLRCFIVIDNFTVQSEHVDLLALPAVRMIKLAPEIATAMRTDSWLQQRVASVAQTARALGTITIVKRIQSRAEAQWFREFGVEFVQSQAVSPGETIRAITKLERI